MIVAETGQPLEHLEVPLFGRGTAMS